MAAILLPYAYFKLVGTEEYVFIFQTLGAEPAGRYVAAILELATVLLLFLPRTATQGALTGILIMLGAIGAHAFVLGFAVQGDHGAMFFMACTALISLIFLILLREED